MRKTEFQKCLQKSRCLIVADGFYEWQQRGKVKKPFGFAGLYESWRSPNCRQINTCTIITTDSNELIMPVHDRMPVILSRDNESIWLNCENQNEEELLSLLKPYSAEAMKIEEVKVRLE